MKQKYRQKQDRRRMSVLSAVIYGSVFFASHAQASCGASFCLVNTDWAVQGAWLDHGTSLDLRYEQVKQNVLWSGSDHTAPIKIDSRNQEINTLSRRWLGNLDYGFNDHWGISIVVPFLDRQHLHTELGQAVTWNFQQLGDTRILARYQTALQDDAQGGGSVGGLHLGTKLPTGRYAIANNTGTFAERSLQPGTGTTDLIVGAYYRSVLPDFASSWFVQTSAELPLNKRDNYRPGKKWGVDLGMRTEWTEQISPMLQLNYQYKGRDSGDMAEPDSSGGRTLTISPGLSIKLSHQWHVYSFVQIPLYQYANGTQLTPKWAATAGIQTKF